ncbi:imidazole glycerol phosphate synthase subunit HisH [Constantimarinum furrinae]|uniref:Imidazole glycerol phosphate synthase subunit HisH n=1 Tax=Constantimarinum furrinae TaxID=2562285 RepID=A0A7G8PWI4_9FLAO|nr:imidazole glycerol phosphate synthase subunit HisH [Constantimarinum furrinae]QNJ98700.1 Imidazole glycerol phosphate synthase subunit HisH [Constantimarinum furrinae]
MNIVIIDYGAGNIQSLKFAIERLGYSAKLSSSAEQIRNADKIIFPGVGEASNALQQLKQNGLDEVIPTLQQPVLGICLGMQLLCKSTKEGNTTGLGIFDVDVIRFSQKVKVPQIGWNEIESLNSLLFKGIKEREYMYLVHSYYAPLCEQTIATTFYDTNYSSALQKDNFYGFQFHPEKSGKAGSQLLNNFLTL